jgi:hypothetical protein
VLGGIAALIGLTGLYQISPWKYACLPAVSRPGAATANPSGPRRRRVGFLAPGAADRQGLRTRSPRPVTRWRTLLTLDDTVEFFNLALATQLTDQEKRDLVVFLRAL